MNLIHRSSTIGLAAVLLALNVAACDVTPVADAEQNESAVEATAQSLTAATDPVAPSGETQTATAQRTAGGGGGGNSFWCDDAGGCSCLGGSLSQDCWLLSQYCVDRFVCSPYPPYRCDCHWKLVVQPQQPVIRAPLVGTKLEALR